MIKQSISLIFLLTVYAFLAPYYVLAKDQAISGTDFCNVTKITTNDYEPETFETSNNLLRKPGESPLFCGERIIIHGKILDQNCLPVSDAKVYIWQTNCKGKYPYTPLKDIAEKELIDINHNLTFTGNGTATTDNNGEFFFITVYPASVHNLGPHINVRIEHYELGALQSRLILKGHKIKNLPVNSPVYEFVEENNTDVYDFELVLPGSTTKNYTMDLLSN